MNDLAAKYHFADFTRAAYRDLILAAQKQYPFAGYGDFAGRERFVLWRHDVDMSMHAALALARIEAEAGVKATYFLLPGSAFYNLLEPEIAALTREIRRLGHAFGLHFDAAACGVERAEDLTPRLERARNFLEDYCEAPVGAFSFHNPDARSAGFQELHYAGMVNAYATCFRATIAYCSDSNGIWRHQRLADVLHEAPARLQVLTHPEWWTETPRPPRRKVFDCIMGRAGHVLADYNRLLHAGGRANVMELAAEFAALDFTLGDAALPVQMHWLRGDAVAAVRCLVRICVDRLGTGDPRLARYLPLLDEAMTADDVRFLIALLQENQT